MGVFGFCFGCLEHLVFLTVIVILVHVGIKHGISGVLRVLLQAIKMLPGAEDFLHKVLSGEVKSFTRQIKGPNAQGKPKQVDIPEKELETTKLIYGGDSSVRGDGGGRGCEVRADATYTIPEHKACKNCWHSKGVSHDDLLAEMAKIKEGDINPEDGKIFAYVYTSEGDTFETQRKAYDMFSEKTGLTVEHDKLVKTFHHAFMHENALNPMVFPSLRRFENEVVSMTAAMMHGDENVVGSLTSGGTESILMAMKTYRDRARALFPHIEHPNMVASITIHPAHEKAAHYFGFKIIHVQTEKDYTVDPAKIEKAITPSTIAILCSAPQYCHGIVDPIEKLSEIAVRRGVPLHVDACFGGFMLPWVEKLGYPVPKFDFRNAGVMSITADIHKYGFGAKGSSVVLYRNAAIRKYQLFAYSQWPGGLFGSPSMAGTRPGGNIAASWVALRAMGQDGYLKMAQKMMDTTNKLKEGINAIPGLRIIGNPHMTSFAIGADDKSVDILALADALEDEGWKPERQQFPASLHFSILPHHIPRADALIEELTKAANTVRNQKGLSKKGSAAMYGMVANIPDKSIIDDFIVEFFSEVYTA